MSTATMAVLATLMIKDGSAEAFESSMRDVREKVRANEPGCLRYDIARGPNPGGYRVFELYESPAAFEQHNSQPYVIEAAAMLSTALAAPPIIEMHEVLD